ncbi:hypothetical protein, partial [Klebsiella pneumoniae]|uniref:hypothetical protein n=1 Tax=Klebsiella pneumoniae TaxID=573 RepID=UPI003853591D
GADFDGWATLVSALVGFGTYVVLAFAVPRRESELDREAAVLADLAAEREASENEEVEVPA